MPPVCAECCVRDCFCDDPVYVALKNKKWEDVKPILAEPDYVLPYAFLTSLCRIGTCAVERGFINTLIGVGEPHVSRSYGPFDFTLLHIALIFGNEYQLKTYFNGLTYKQWSSLCERKDSRGMKPIDLAAHIIDSIKTDNLHRVKRYFPSESEQFWREFDFDCWEDDSLLFLTKMRK